MVALFNKKPSPPSAVVFGKYALAYGFLALLFVFSFIPLHIGGLHNIRPPFFLIAIFFWTVFRPNFLPIWLLFGLGVLHDLITAYPLGLSALIYLGAQWGIKKQQRFLGGQHFLILWVGYGLMSLGAILAYWGGFSLVTFSIAPFFQHMAGYFMGILIFPLLLFPLQAFSRSLRLSDD